MNYRLTIQYDGTDFHGWQMQDDLRTVQGELTRALSSIEGRAVVIHGAGRTDAGVHAEAQIGSVRLRRAMTPERLCAAINGNVARDVRVVEAEAVPDEFHARFSARGKTYCYRIFNARSMSPFWARYAHQEARDVDVSALRKAAPLFLGAHDWTAFSSAKAEVRTRVRNLTRLEINDRRSNRGRGTLIEIIVSADGFLRYMARSIAGTLLAHGRGEIDEDTIARAITTGDRTLVGATAPACGLTLVQVHYETEVRG
ncbi:MAG TPA: tRNA pseudouridine(38-40) synthase TruA [Pyrinomonadaceae bacterium]|jgi:tRNA pseudouridine38-40 synthase|nr:tRNA pseudouridine(38-40) synthase TruA [Pyrinomonadaceae bacterium]